MIVGIIVNLIYGLVWLVLAPIRLLPDVSLPSDIAAAISTAGGYLYAVDFVLPVSSLLAIFALFLSIEGGILTWKGINWILRRLPTQS
jgi:hypothetical protein